MEEYWGDYKNKGRQVILYQTVLEKVLNWCFTSGSRRYFLPHGVMALGIILLFIAGNILGLHHLSNPIFKMMTGLVIISFIPMLMHTYMSIYRLFFFEKKMAPVLQYIEAHPMCSYNDIVENNITPKTYYLSDEMVIDLRSRRKIITMMDLQNQTFYRIATEADWQRWGLFDDDEYDDEDFDDDEFI